MFIDAHIWASSPRTSTAIQQSSSSPPHTPPPPPSSTPPAFSMLWNWCTRHSYLHEHDTASCMRTTHFYLHVHCTFSAVNADFKGAPKTCAAPPPSAPLWTASQPSHGGLFSRPATPRRCSKDIFTKTFVKCHGPLPRRTVLQTSNALNITWIRPHRHPVSHQF